MQVLSNLTKLPKTGKYIEICREIIRKIYPPVVRVTPSQADNRSSDDNSSPQYNEDGPVNYFYCCF